MTNIGTILLTICDILGVAVIVLVIVLIISLIKKLRRKQ